MPRIKLVWITLISCFLLVSCQSQSPSAVDTDPSLQHSITSYLVEQVGISGFDGEIFCAFDYLESARETDQEIYIWALCQEYYLEGTSLREGSGISLPVALQTHRVDGQTEIIGCQIPRDGSYYGSDVKEIFPPSSWSKILPNDEEGITQYNQRAAALERETALLASEFYTNPE